MEMSSTPNLTADLNPENPPTIPPLEAAANDNKDEPEEGSVTGEIPGWKTKTLFEKLKYVRRVITVEPIVICVVLALTVAKVTVEVLFIYKACRVNLNYSEEICNEIVTQNKHNYTVEQQAAHIIVTSMNTWRFSIQYAIPLVLILFLGSYSDRHKVVQDVEAPN